MKNIILGLILVCCVLLGITSCEDSGSTEIAKEQASAYFTVFEYLYETDPGLNSDSSYIAVDLTNAKLIDTESLIELIENFCNENGYILLQNSFDELEEKGYIKDWGFFEDGFLISFDDIKLDSNTLVTSARKWRSGIGAIGAEYTVKKKNEAWKITKTENNWIS